MSPEVEHGHEFADDKILKTAYDGMKEWLLEKGMLTHANTRSEIDARTGLNIYITSDDGPFYTSDCYEYEVNSKDVARIDPSIRQGIAMGVGKVVFDYTPAYYEYNTSTQILEFYPNHCGAIYSADDTSPYKDLSVSISVSETDEGILLLRSDKHGYGIKGVEPVSKSDSYSENELSSLVINGVENMLFETALGANRLTACECQAILDILSALKELN